ncbi:sirohydrochlorin chelatase [Yimella sp. NH-Cas1]|uniref:sirohydrochlorin chelatase n=1 Tax=Yimella sp. NH-Cas1 TaxID=2917726 RepID=UPI001EFC1D28|nr:sirohydrochlorin chelatase [Yimella sp. NH-Cas1]
MRALVVCAHGTDNPQGQDVVRSIVAQVAGARPDLVVREAYVDVQQPELPVVVNELAAQHDSVTVVPLLLSSGFHTEVDVANAVESHANATATRALGPHDLLADVLTDRLRSAGADEGDSIVLAVAGSSRDAGATDAEAMRDLLAQRRSGPVSIGYLAAREPSVPDAVAAARRSGQSVALASYLIGPGFFHDRLQRAGVDVVADPLGDDPRLAQLVALRFAGVEN